MRRAPEDARAHILAAAERVFAQHLPDAVGLKEIARAAGVSHALIGHYFGTYAALVEATLEGRFSRLRESLVSDLVVVLAKDPPVGELLAAYRRAIASAAGDPMTIRLAAWAILSGRADAEDFFSHRLRGLKLLADTLEARAKVKREDLEFCIVVSFAMAITTELGRRALAGGLGKRALAEGDLEARTRAMLDAYLARAARHQ
ncbi:MAG TPA: helix-turn-helix domain-containing protein [Labilithrix sp.]